MKSRTGFADKHLDAATRAGKGSCCESSARIRDITNRAEPRRGIRQSACATVWKLCGFRAVRGAKGRFENQQVTGCALARVLAQVAYLLMKALRRLGLKEKDLAQAQCSRI